MCLCLFKFFFINGNSNCFEYFALHFFRMNTFHVSFQVVNSRKALAASLANKWFLPGVGSYVCGQFLSCEKSFHTLGALVGKLVQMPPFPET